VGLGSIEFKQATKTTNTILSNTTVGRNDLQSYVSVAGGVNLTRMDSMML